MLETIACAARLNTQLDCMKRDNYKYTCTKDPADTSAPQTANEPVQNFRAPEPRAIGSGTVSDGLSKRPGRASSKYANEPLK
jgi:hypothetical protein